jgi:hypothetical protein
MSYPKFGTQPIRCSKRACKWRGYETDLKGVPHPTLGALATQKVCPSCGCDSYYFMTPKQADAWERAKATDGVAPSDGRRP